MARYLVTWTIDVEDAGSPEEAARQARLYQAPGTSAVVFDVTAPDGTQTEVDLGTYLDETEPPSLAEALIARYHERSL